MVFPLVIEIRKDDNRVADLQLDLKFPFVGPDEIKLAFRGIPNQIEVYRSCPREFKENWESNPWCKLALHIFYCDLSDEEAEKFEYRSKNEGVAEAQLEYFNIWLGNVNQSHDSVIAVCGWLLSLMLIKYPS